MEDGKQEEKKEGCCTERSPEPIWKWFYYIWRWFSFVWSSLARLHVDKQRGPCGTTIPSSTSQDIGQHHKQLSTGSWTKYDVFLNHRGPDVKNTFVSHLEAALRRAGRDPFLDAKSLVKGQHAFTSINEALAGVLVHVAVFSPKYAESKYCLNELCDMLESKKPIIPVYYDVEPENLRCTVTRPFAGAFRKHLKKGRDKDVARWKAALLQAAEITGFRRHDYANDEKLVKKVVAVVLEHLPGPPQVAPAHHPVGLGESSSRVIEMLHKMEGNVRVVGICGMGGIGKTTLARHVYNREQPSFANSCFVQDVKEAKGDAVRSLQMKMLKDLAHEDAFDSGCWFERIRKRKVLLVIDDISEVKSFYDLVPDLNELGFGSEVLVTSRNQDVLKSIMRDIPQNEVYHVPGLSDSDSVELFTWCAFRRNNLEAVDAAFHKFVKEITGACGGLPLALEVMGGHLAHRKNLSKDEKYWNEALSALRSKTEITTKLRTSYDNLDDENCKFMFLDIACFMLSHPVEVALEVWESDERYKAPRWLLEELVERCLVKVEFGGRLSMHDLLRDMGQNIVEEKASQKLEMLSHVWDPEMATKLLQKKEGVNEALAALRVDGVDPSIACRAEAYSRLNGLKYLAIDGYSVRGDFSKWSEEMRWLQWRYFQGEEFPSCLKLPNLGVLDLACSLSLRHLWPRDNESQVFCRTLRLLDLSHCKKLETILLNINEFVNLKVLYLVGCWSLESLPESFSELSNLETLNLSGCKKFWKLPASVRGLKKLRVLWIGGTAVVHLPQDFGLLQSLIHVDFRGCWRLEGLPDSFSELWNLETLHLSWCMKFWKIPASVCGLKKLRVLRMPRTAVVHLPEDFGRLQSLINVDFEECRSLEELPESFSELSNLETLDLSGCEKFQKLPDSFSELSNLETLNLSRCEKFEKLPASVCGLKKLTMLLMQKTAVLHLPQDFGQLQSLIHIDFEECSSLEELPDSFSKLSNLETLNLSRCEKFQKLPASICGLKKLRVLRMPKTAMVHLPQDFGRLQSLADVDFEECSSLEELLDSLSELSNLETLNLSRCEKLWKLPASVCGLKKLRVLRMPKTAVVHLPEDFGRLQSLIDVDFEECSSLEELPDSFSELSNLETLNLSRCEKLWKLPASVCGLKKLRVFQMQKIAVVHLPQDFGQLQTLFHVEFEDCSSLEELPDSFSKLSNLELLIFSRCEKLWKLPASVSGLKKLRVLRMQKTAVLHLPQDFGQLQSLIHIDFEECSSLEELPDSFSKLSNLETLDLSRCKKLWKLPASICGLKKLTMLRMRDTAIVHLPQDFGQLQSLTSIDFGSCGSLEELPDSFSKLSNLETLNLSECEKFWKLPTSVCGLKKLRVSRIQNTAVVHLPRDFGQLQSLIYVDLKASFQNGRFAEFIFRAVLLGDTLPLWV